MREKNLKWCRALKSTIFGQNRRILIFYENNVDVRIEKSVKIFAYGPNEHFYRKKTTRDMHRKKITTRDIKFLAKMGGF